MAKTVSKPTPIKFRTKLLQGDKTAVGMIVPPEVVEKLEGGKRPLVKVTINGFTYRSAVAVMDGDFMVGVSAENRAGAKVKGGDTVEVTLQLDTEPRIVEIPKDLKAALTKAGAMKAYEASAPSMKKEYVRQVEEAKAQETRERRIAKIVEKLSG
jgi:hypothetical protein